MTENGAEHDSDLNGSNISKEWATITYHPIGVIHSSYLDQPGTPIQGALNQEEEAMIEIFPEYEAGLKDLDGFSRIIVLYHFHKSKGYHLTARPYLDDKPRGIFSIRGPRRPNPIGLTIVRLERVEKNRLFIKGVDMLEGTPVLDIKPYVPRIDSYPDSKIGWAENKFDMGTNQPPHVADERFMTD